MTTFNAILMTIFGALAAGAGASPAAPATVPPAPVTVAADPAAVEEVEEVLVTGERAGPGLWKVRKGDHTLYLLATLAPAPKKLQWRSREVEEVLGRAQVFVPARFDVDADIGPISGLRLYLQYRKLRGNEDGRSLQEVLPPPVFARFEALRLKYAPRDRAMLERRPALAVSELWRAAVDRSGLSNRSEVGRTVEKLARERKVKLALPEVRIEDPRDTLAEAGQIPLDAEIACAEAVLGRLESDLANARQRAESWAVGDVAGLRSGAAAQASQTCLDSLRSSARISAVLRDFEAAWLKTVTDSLERNTVTLAVADIDGLLRPGGLLAKLRARGYEIDEP